MRSFRYCGIDCFMQNTVNSDCESVTKRNAKVDFPFLGHWEHEAPLRSPVFQNFVL